MFPCLASCCTSAPSQGRRLRAARPAPDDAERLAGGYRALGEPTRLSLALALRDGHELCVCDLSWIAERPQNLVSHHMKALKARASCVPARDGKMTMYTLTEQGARAPRRARRDAE